MRRTCQPFNQRMLGRDDHVSGTVERVGARCVNTQHIARRMPWETADGSCFAPCFEFLRRRSPLRTSLATDKEVDLGARAPADPIALQRLDAVRPVDQLEIVL